MTGIKEAIIDLLKSPEKHIERQDQLIDQIFNIKMQNSEYNRVAALLKIVGPRIKELTSDSIDAITGLIQMLQMDADPRQDAEDRDENWNEIILQALEKKLRDAYMVLGPAEHSPSDDLERVSVGVKAYRTIEQTELEREAIETPNRIREWQTKAILGGRKNE